MPHLINATIDFQILDINIIFEHRVMVNFEVATSIFRTKLINAATFNQVNMENYIVRLSVVTYLQDQIIFMPLVEEMSLLAVIIGESHRERLLPPTRS